MESTEIKQIEADPLTDKEIKEYLPDVPIIKYSDLSEISSIEQLLPKDKTYVICLYEESPNVGHWICFLRYNNIFEYFDSYGEKIDSPLNWTSVGIRKELDQYTPYLSNLLKKSKLKVVQNKTKYQKESSNIATCGRWCIFRILSNRKEDIDLPEFKQLIKKCIKTFKVPNDELISYLISAT